MTNRLAHETSPYLRQHQSNPVDWYPWGPEALKRAKAEDKPILLSVGYSACHWCHVMEHESFDDVETAAVMNEHFVNIKVDREERPDIDELYMGAVQAFSGGRGGWPMTVFLTPDGTPFFGGTYFPPEARYGMPSFRQVLQRCQDLYLQVQDGRTDILEKMTDILRTNQSVATSTSTESDWLARIAEDAGQTFDEEDGGFGWQPKFPPHGTLAALLVHWYRTQEPRSLRMVTYTLDCMAKGGMYDLLGGGFCRYSVDNYWLIPHFEKMLYDNAQLIPIYLDAHRITQKPEYARIVRETITYLMRDMRADCGAFYAAEDADSEGEEGKFYAWTPKELRKVAGTLDGVRLCGLLNVLDGGNFEHGTSVLRLEEPIESLDPDDQALLAEALPKLLEVRSKRVRPGRDDKIITSWNALLISALAKAGAVLQEPSWLDAAKEAALFLHGQAKQHGRLMRISDGTTSKIPGFLDDVAFFLNALLDLYHTTLDTQWLDLAKPYAQEILDRFWDDEAQALFYTASDAESLHTRPRRLLGGAEPGGSAMVAYAFARLYHLTEEAHWADRARSCLAPLTPYIERAPRAMGYEAIAHQWLQQPPTQVSLAGPTTAEWHNALHQQYAPFAVAAHADTASFTWLQGKESGEPCAILCANMTCAPPVHTVADFHDAMSELQTAARIQPAKTRAPQWPQDPDRWLNTPSPLNLSSLKGHVVVLDFWASCCINCIHVLPELAAVERHFEGQPVQIIGVHSAKFTEEQERDHVANAIAEYGVLHPVLNDPEREVWSQYAVKGWPTLVVIDPAGGVAWKKSGEVHRGALIGVIEDLLQTHRKDCSTAPTVVSTAPRVSDGLQFPGKVLTWVPDSGRSPWDQETLVYVSNRNGHQIWVYAAALGTDGWPTLTHTATFGAGTAGFADGVVTEAQFQSPQGMARIGDILYVADAGNHAIRAVHLSDGTVRTIAGDGALGRGGPLSQNPNQTRLRSPWDITAIDNILFIAMAGTHQVWIYNPKSNQLGPVLGSGAEGLVDGTADNAALAQPSALSVVGPYLVFADSETSSIRAFDFRRRLVATVVGRGLFDFGDVDSEDSEQVRLQHPMGVVGDAPWLYVADTYNHKIKRIQLPEGQSESLTTPQALRNPAGLDHIGEFLIVADTGNHRVVAVHKETGEIRPL